MTEFKPIPLTETQMAELFRLRQRVAELEKERDKATQYWQMLKQQRDELSRLCEFNEKTMGKLLKQRDELLKAMALAMPVMDAHAGPSRLADFHAAIASVKEKA